MIKKIKSKIRSCFSFFKLNKNQRKLERYKKLQASRVKPWFAVEGDKTLRLNYDLNFSSVIFDLGGYKGEWSDLIYNKYESHIYIFEPVKLLYEALENKYNNNPKIHIFNYGLSSKDQEIALFLDDNSSTMINKWNLYKDKKEFEKIYLRSYQSFINEYEIDKISLMKINIEGGEYELLEYLTNQQKFLERIENIQVQFHDFESDSKKRMKNIQNILSRTHYLTYQFEFVWENWKLKE